MSQTVYVCPGNCQAEISEEQFKEGLTHCGAETCDKKGVPFEKRLKCEVCGAVYLPNQSHEHR